MYKNYIFDLYGTLIDIRTNESKAFLWEKMACFYGYHGAVYTPKELKAEYLRMCRLAEEKLPEKEEPEIEITEVFLQLFQNKNVKGNMELAVHGGEFFRILSLKYIRLYDGVIELLEELKKAGKSIYVLSNAQKIFTEPEVRLLDIEKYFNGICYSSDYGCKKPSPVFYEALLSQYHLEKKQSIMIGNDSDADIKGAYNAGLPSLYIHSNLSPEITGELYSNFKIMNGDIHKVTLFLFM